MWMKRDGNCVSKRSPVHRSWNGPAPGSPPSCVRWPLEQSEKYFAVDSTPHTPYAIFHMKYGIWRMKLAPLRYLYREHFGRDLFQQLRADHRRHAGRIHSRVEFDEVRADDIRLEPLDHIQCLAS